MNGFNPYLSPNQIALLRGNQSKDTISSGLPEEDGALIRRVEAIGTLGTHSLV